jgi:hypothetical protein
VICGDKKAPTGAGDFLMFALTLTGFVPENLVLRADYTSFRL